MEWLYHQLQGAIDRFILWLADFYADFLIAGIELIIKISYRFYDKFLTYIEQAIGNLSLHEAWVNIDPWTSFSPQVLYLLDKFNIATVLAIIASGYSIRMFLNLLPFVKI